MFNRKYIFQGSVFYCYVSLTKCFFFADRTSSLISSCKPPQLVQATAMITGGTKGGWRATSREKSSWPNAPNVWNIYLHEWLKLMFFLWVNIPIHGASGIVSLSTLSLSLSLSLSLCLSQTTCTSLESKSFPWPFQADIRSGVRLEVSTDRW